MTSQIVVDARSRYLHEFRLHARGGPEVFYIEPALRTADGAVAVEGALQLPVRADLIRKEDCSVFVVDTPPVRRTDHASTLVCGVTVSIDAPHWDALTIHLRGCAHTEFASLKRWFETWFDAEDHNQLNDEGAYGVVHFLSDPRRVGNDTLISVDLGSAPIIAFDQLLVTLADYRPERIELRTDNRAGTRG